MWPWIYRIVAVLLALIGSALASLFVQPLRERAQQVLADLAPIVVVAYLGAFGMVLLILAMLIAVSPATRTKDDRHA